MLHALHNAYGLHDPAILIVKQFIWAKTHDSATKKLASHLSLALLFAATQVLDIRVQQESRVYHWILLTYSLTVLN